MSKSINKVILMGNVGQDPEIQDARGGIVVTLSLATDESFKTNGAWIEKTEWHTLVAFQRNAEILRDYVRKGSKIFIQGKLRTNSWEDRQTGRRSTGRRSSSWSLLFCHSPTLVTNKQMDTLRNRKLLFQRTLTTRTQS
jgi:single stranded DNA-binding protein